MDYEEAYRKYKIKNRLTKEHRLYIGKGENQIIINYTVAHRRFMTLIRLWRFAAYPAVTVGMFHWIDAIMAMPSNTVAQLGDFMAEFTLFGLILMGIIAAMAVDLRHLLYNLSLEHEVKEELKR